MNNLFCKYGIKQKGKKCLVFMDVDNKDKFAG